MTTGHSIDRVLLLLLQFWGDVAVSCSDDNTQHVYVCQQHSRHQPKRGVVVVVLVHTDSSFVDLGHAETQF